MKHTAQCEKNLKTLLKKQTTGELPEFAEARDPVAMLLLSFLMWESTTEKAIVAYGKIRERIVDFNDLRVTMPHELVSWIGARYPRSLDRCQRIRACLRDVYLREHVIDLSSVEQLGKREARKYVESLAGIVPYVSSRSMLLSFGIHSMPVDDQLRTELVEAGAADVEVEVPELTAWLTRQVKSADGVATHVALQAWMDERHGTKRTRTAPKKTRTSKTTTKTTTSKTTATTKKKTSTRKSAAKSSVKKGK